MANRGAPVPEGSDGERLDVVISRLFGVSRANAAALIADGAVRLDGAGVTTKSTRAVAQQWLEVELPDAQSSTSQDPSGVQVIYEDADIIVIDKPAGVASHPSPGWSGPTVPAALRALGHRLASHGPAEREGIVHRLDVGTSGLMVVAASELAYTTLKDAFRERAVTKVYHALAQGHPSPSSGTIDAPIDRHPTAPYRFAVVSGGRESITHYDTLEAFRYASLLSVDLETGRTHQIRVHLAELRHPCAGDLTYGADPTLASRLELTRQWLHAVRLEFRHPTTGVSVEFESAYSPDLTGALDYLRALD